VSQPENMRVPGRSALRDASGGFWSWWGRSLVACLPGRWRAQLGATPQRLLLAVEEGELSVTLESGEQRRVLASGPQESGFPLDASRWQDLPRHWLLPAGAVLRRRLSLPQAAADRLHDVVGFEIDRQTPFSAEQVFFDARVLGTQPDGQLDVELVAVPRERMDMLARAPWAGTLAGADVADAMGRPLGVNLLPVAQRQRRRDPLRRWNMLLAAAALFFLHAAGAQLLDNRREAVAQLHAQVEREAQQARRVTAERQQLQDLVDGAAFVNGKRHERASMVSLWNELTVRLPDDTWLERLAIESGELQLIGLSGAASSLASRLEGAAGWSTPTLTSVLQAEDGAQRGRFTLSAKLKPQSEMPQEDAHDAADHAP
jgi:general secretion pathway protein L